MVTVFILFTGFTVNVSAATHSDLCVYNAEQITSDLDATFITGEVRCSTGQTVSISNGEAVIASKVMPNTGTPSYFRIKIPRQYLNEDQDTSFAVTLISAEDPSDKQTTYSTIIYKEKKDQEIQVSDAEQDLKLNVPGDNHSLRVKATSGLGLTFSSSDESVAKVDANGVIEPIGEGTVEITVKQENSADYKNAEKIITVAVKERPYFTVIFHANNGTDDTIEQKIAVGESTALKANQMSFEEYPLLGWAESENGRPVYTDEEEIKNLAEAGETVDLYAVWKGARAQAAVDWAMMIADDNSFAYGTGAACHRCGCYFCGTNQRLKPRGYEKTYVCMTFTGAAYAHGAKDPQILARCQAGKMTMHTNGQNFTEFDCWEKVGSCKNLSISDLQPGDVLIQWGNGDNGAGSHACIYCGGDILVEAMYEGWGARTISYHSGAAKRLRQYGSNSKNYVMRYKF